jgi:hypothetical protein
MATKCSIKSGKKVMARDLYVRSEIRFNTRQDLDFVKRAAKKSGAKSMNAWMVWVLSNAAARVLDGRQA